MPRAGSAEGPSTTAPAPSAKITAVARPRVLTSMPVDCTSWPTTSTWRNRPALDVGVRRRQGVDESAALGPDIEGGNGPEAEPVLQQHAVAGREVIRRGGGQHDRVDVGVGEARRRDRGPARPFGKVDAGFSLAHPVPLADAGALGDPLVSGVHDRREVVIGDDAIGDGHAGAEDEASGHWLPGGYVGTRGKMLPAGATDWQGRRCRTCSRRQDHGRGRTRAKRQPPKRSRSFPVPTAARPWRSAVDPTGGAEQEYVEDCPVCCQPWQVHVEVDSDGRVHVWADAADE